MRYCTAKVLGAPLPDDVLMRNVGIPLREQMREFSAEHAEALVDVYREHNDRVHDSMVRGFPGVEAALEELESLSFRLGVVTSKSRTIAARGLECLNLTRFFEVLVTCDDVSKYKPDPYPLVYAAGLLGLETRHCAYVGDSPRYDSGGRRRMRVRRGALGSRAERVLAPGPEYAVSSMTEVALLFEGGEVGYRAC
jgi:pyrophosphatase PpaX